MTEPIADEPFVLNAGRTGPFVLIERKHVPWYGALIVGSALLAWPIASTWQPLGFVGTLTFITVLLAVVVAGYYRTKAYLDWRASEVYFTAAPDALTGWHGTAQSRHAVATFATGETLAVASDTRTALPRLVVTAAGESLVLGPLWGIYPQEYERWRSWVESHGWTVNDTYIEDPNSKRARPLRVADDWVEFSPQDDAAQFVFGIPLGPDLASVRAGGRENWLPAKNPKHVGAFTSTLPGAQVTSVAVCIGDVPPEVTVSEFGGVASAAEIRQGGVIADLDFAEDVDAVAVSHTADGRVELRFRRASGDSTGRDR
ncbi:hypothetical protein [Demequina aurantiaca]|uniref:hypothetical protein n=1 Tax=Demequina aurantiaca TaxID=676200 RepID=UPI000782613F|nr:hypothetical protein [Demequina aurantiaca]